MDTQELLRREQRTAIETWCHRNTQSVYLGDTVLCRVLGKYLMYTLPDDRSLTPHLTLDGYWEMWITMAIARYIKPGMRCIDVGANVGYYAVILADWVGPTGHVDAIEAEARNYRALKANAERAGSHCVAYHCAASDQAGYLRLRINPHRGGDHYVDSSGADIERTDQHVRAVTLDELVGENRVDFIKLDVEGHERSVWLGMARLLARNEQIQIAAEWIPKCDPQCELGAMAESCGFKLHEVHTDGTLRPTTLEVLRGAEPDSWRMLWFKR